jgi:hypothetical protein
VQERLVVLGFAVAAGGDAPVALDPGVGAFDRPAVAALGVGGFQAPPATAPDLARAGGIANRLAAFAGLADARLDVAVAQLLFERGGGVAAVGPQLAGRDAAVDQRVDQGQQVAALVLVAGRQPNGQRQPAGVDG